MVNKDQDLLEWRDTLEWYAEQARLCRLITSEGNSGRNALHADGGKRAVAALALFQSAKTAIVEREPCDCLIGDCKKDRLCLEDVRRQRQHDLRRSSMRDDQTCSICDQPLLEGQQVISDVNEGVVHYDCCGPSPSPTWTPTAIP